MVLSLDCIAPYPIPKATFIQAQGTPAGLSKNIRNKPLNIVVCIVNFAPPFFTLAHT